MCAIRSIVLSAALTSAMATSAAGQWLNSPTPGVTRLANGKIDLGAPAPRPEGEGAYGSSTLEVPVSSS